jgi:uncharacterized protein YdeI (YjbR/CyaY-like superfamily)
VTAKKKAAANNVAAAKAAAKAIAKQVVAKKAAVKKDVAKKAVAKKATIAEKNAIVNAAAAKKTWAPVKPRHFASAESFGTWLDQHHADADELWVGFWKKGTGKPSIDWPQSVREALRVGWIDGIRKPLNDEAYVIRFTPRRVRSVWSAINIRIVEELIAGGRMLEAGLRAFEGRHAHHGSGYRIAERPDQLPAAAAKRMKAHPAASAFWQAQPPGYRRLAVHRVTSARRDETRERRLRQLIESCAAGLRLGD